MEKNYLHATSMVADWLLALPRGDHAKQSHLNGDLPKYSKTKSFDIVAVTSCSWTPVWGSTCESRVDGGGCELPLHLNVSYSFEKKNTQKNKTKDSVIECEWDRGKQRIELKKRFLCFRGNRIFFLFHSSFSDLTGA